MKKKARYPLEQVAMIKNKRLEEAEKILKEKKQTLNKEEENLRTAIAKRDKVLQHKEDKIKKHLDEMEQGTTSDKIEIGERYIKKVVEEELAREEKKVEQQKEVVKKAEEAVEVARQNRIKKNQEVEKLRLHKKEWQKEQAFIEMREEGAENDELGSNMFARKKK